MEKEKLQYIRYYYDMDYVNLKKCLITMEEHELKLLLGEELIKKKIINDLSSDNFVELAKDADNNIFVYLLDDQGIEMLVNSVNLSDKLISILTSGNKYVNQLFANDNFLKIIVDNFYNLKYFLQNIEVIALDELLNFLENDKDKQINILSIVRENTVLEYVQNYKINNEILLDSLCVLPKNVIEYLLVNDFRIQSLSSLSLTQLYDLFVKNIHIPRKLLDEEELINKIVTMYDPLEYRFFIQALSESNNVELIEKKRKEYYEQQIKGYNEEIKMIPELYDLYLEIETMLMDDTEMDDLYIFLQDKINVTNYSKEYIDFYLNINENKYDLEKIKSYFQEQSNYMLTNMIIDYHYEDIYYNFLLDLRQLINLQSTDIKTISDIDLVMYKKLLNLDSLEYVDKLELFEELKTMNPIEKQYDDFRKAKNDILIKMKKKMLNFENIDQFYNKELSEKEGVKIWELNGEPFYAFVKAFLINKDTILDYKAINNSYVDISSYTLDGHNKLNTYKHPRNNYNIIFGDFNINQVMHMYPVDSYSTYIRGVSKSATNRVYELLSLEQFVSKSFDYNEIVYLQKNDKRFDELNDLLDRPKIMGIYCYDDYTQNDVISAKKLGVGIVVIKTKKYNIDKSEQRLDKEDRFFVANATEEGIDYVTQINQKGTRR